MLIVAMSLAVVVPIQAQVFPPPAEMSIAVRAAQDPSLDDAGRQKLLGKDYAGLITVRAVRLRPDGSAVVEADLPQPTAGRPAIRLRFTTTEDNQLVQTLRPDQSLRIRATLTRFAGTPAAPVLEFSGFDPSSQR